MSIATNWSWTKRVATTDETSNWPAAAGHAGQGHRVEGERQRAGSGDPVRGTDLLPGDRLCRAVQVDERGSGERADRRRRHEHDENRSARSASRDPPQGENRDEIAPDRGKSREEEHRDRQQADRDDTGGDPGQGRHDGDEWVGAGQVARGARAADAAFAEEERPDQREPDDQALDGQPPRSGPADDRQVPTGSARRREGRRRAGGNQQRGRRDRDADRSRDRQLARTGGHEQERQDGGENGGRQAHDQALQHHRQQELAARCPARPAERKGRPAALHDENADEGKRRKPDGGRTQPDHGKHRGHRRPAGLLALEQRKQAASQLGSGLDRVPARRRKRALEPPQVGDQPVDAIRFEPIAIDEVVPRVPEWHVVQPGARDQLAVRSRRDQRRHVDEILVAGHPIRRPDEGRVLAPIGVLFVVHRERPDDVDRTLLQQAPAADEPVIGVGLER